MKVWRGDAENLGESGNRDDDCNHNQHHVGDGLERLGHWHYGKNSLGGPEQDTDQDQRDKQPE